MNPLRRLRWDRDFSQGRRQLDGGDFDGAIQTLERLVKTVDDNPGAWWNLGVAYKFKRAWADSQRCMRHYIELQPQAEEGYYNLGVAATALRDWNEARWAWRGLGLDFDTEEGPPEMKLGLAARAAERDTRWWW
jgi:tetratricopeptide (TPR) repeat protein